MAAVRISGKNGTNQKCVSYVVRKGKNFGSTNVAKVNLNLHMAMYYSGSMKAFKCGHTIIDDQRLN